LLTKSFQTALPFFVLVWFCETLCFSNFSRLHLSLLTSVVVDPVVYPVCTCLSGLFLLHVRLLISVQISPHRMLAWRMKERRIWWFERYILLTPSCRVQRQFAYLASISIDNWLLVNTRLTLCSRAMTTHAVCVKFVLWSTKTLQPSWHARLSLLN